MAEKDQVNSGSGLMETAYLAKMMRSVVSVDTNNPGLGRGSGCIVGLPYSGPMLLTCHYLLSSKDVARNSTIYFDCENRDSPGVGVSGAELFDLSSEDSFGTSPPSDLDYALIAMNPSQIPGEERERFYLHHYQRVSTLKEMDIVHLFHYPLVDGVPTLCSSAGTVKFLSGYLLGYCVESAPGSGGGPVLKEVGGKWVIIGLHQGSLAVSNSETKVATLVEAIHKTVVDVSYRPEEPDPKKIQLASERHHIFHSALRKAGLKEETKELKKTFNIPLDEAENVEEEVTQRKREPHKLPTSTSKEKDIKTSLKDKPLQKDLDVISKKAGDNWRSLLTQLGLKETTIEEFLKYKIGSTSEACFKGLVHWLSGNADKPVTWETLLQALRHSDMVVFADDLEEQLKRHGKLSE